MTFIIVAIFVGIVNSIHTPDKLLVICQNCFKIRNKDEIKCFNCGEIEFMEFKKVICNFDVFAPEIMQKKPDYFFINNPDITSLNHSIDADEYYINVDTLSYDKIQKIILFLLKYPHNYFI